MSKKASPVAVGLFTLSALILAVAGVVVFGSGRFFADTLKFVLYFEGSVKGLGIGSDVKFRGVSVGAVTDVGVVFDPKDFSFAIPVLIAMDLHRFRLASSEIPQDKLRKVHDQHGLFEMLVDRGLRAELKTESLLTGRLFIEIDFHPDAPVAYHGPQGEVRELPTVESKLSQITKSIETIPFDQVIQKVTSSIDTIERILSSPEVSNSLRSLDQTLVEAKKLATGLDTAIDKVSTSLDQTLGETRSMVKEARDKLQGVTQDVGSLASGLKKNSEQLDKLLLNLTEITSGGDELQAEAAQAIRELSNAARSLRVLADTVETRPDVLLRGKPNESER